jgi:hypothetical protein
MARVGTVSAKSTGLCYCVEMVNYSRRRANQYRHRAAKIEQRQLPRVRDESDRKHLLELAAMYRRAADQLP